MFIYNSKNMIPERIKQAKELLDKIPAKHCFITGSFLYKEKYEDIDVFVITRSEKEFILNNNKAKITIIDFNDLHSLFFHSISKSCVSKNVVPTKPLKVTITDYWNVINEAIPETLNNKNKFKKVIRFLILYILYFKNNEILDSFSLSDKINSFKSYEEVLEFVNNNVPNSITTRSKTSYVKKFFYTQASHYRKISGFDAQSFLFKLTHSIVNG